MAYICPAPCILVLMWFQVDPTIYITSFICSRIPIKFGIDRNPYVRLVSFIIRCAICLLSVYECVRVTMLAMLTILLTVTWLSNYVSDLRLAFKFIILRGGILRGQHANYFRQILIPLYAASNVTGLLGFVATVLASTMHILSTYAGIRLYKSYPFSLWLTIMYVSVASFVTQMVTFSFTAKFRDHSANLLREFRMGSNYLDYSSFRKKCYLKDIRALPTPGVPIGVFDHRLFICSKSTVLVAFKVLLDQTINALISF